jgi:HemY protein
MRGIIWLILLFAVAVVAANTFGTNDGLVTFYWRYWRMDMSLNLFLLLMLVSCLALMAVVKTTQSLLGLPGRARQWRVTRRERRAQESFRASLAHYFSGRYGRSQKSAQTALAIKADTPQLAQDREFVALSHLLNASSAHRLQDRSTRDAALDQVLRLGEDRRVPRPLLEGASLLSAEWAIDDHDAPRALELLAALPSGVARRTHALRLRLQAARLAHQPQEALRTARLLAKHHGFSDFAVPGLLRSLALEAMEAVRDMDQLRDWWSSLDASDRADPLVAARAAKQAARWASQDEARNWLRPFWDRWPQLAEDEREALAMALMTALDGMGSEWLPKLETAAQANPRDGAIALAFGGALAERQLWGKARRWLEQAAEHSSLSSKAQRCAWMSLAELATTEGDALRAGACYEAAARLT